MVVVVVVFNVLISMICLFVAWRVWNLRRALAVAANVLISVERNTYAVLHGAPNNIGKGQIGVHGLRERYQQLELQLQQVKQVLALLSLLQGGVRSALRRRSQAAAIRAAALELHNAVSEDPAHSKEAEAVLDRLMRSSSKRSRRPKSSKRRQ